MNAKKALIGILLLWGLGFFSAVSFVDARARPAPADQDSQKGTPSQQSSDPNRVYIKSYTLKHAKPEEILNAARFYCEDATFVDDEITVKIWGFQIQRFEELLKRLDVEKRTVQFQVFVIIASRKPVGKPESGQDASGPGSGVRITPPPQKPKTGGSGTRDLAGAPVTLKFKDTNLRDVVLYLAELARLNVVFDAGVQGVVTCNLEEVPWEKALDIVLDQNRMEMAVEGNVLWVAPAGRLGNVRSPVGHMTLENKDLKKVLDELNSLWNFTSYEVDGPSFLTIRESSGANSYKLVTNRPLNLLISNVKVSGEEAGKRTISIGELKLSGMANFVDIAYIETHEIVLKEKGYLVAGVSGYGSSSQQALILVINGEIK